MANDDFTFAAVVPAPLLLSAGGGGRVGPLYPVFGRPRSPPRPAPPAPATATARVPLGRILLVDRKPPPPHADDDGDDLDTVPAEMYCPWSPGWSAAAAASPARCKKSGSTGSVLRWRPRLVGRSQSDGKEKFVFLSAASASGSGRKAGRSGGDGGGGVSAALGGHAWSYYAKGSGGGARRRSFLPYKQDVVGLFANAAVFRRSYHPF
ncbi:unnamed protein product [Urochloa humidicola]